MRRLRVFLAHLRGLVAARQLDRDLHQEIAAHLKMQRQNVTPELKVLNSEGLLEIVGDAGGKDLWGKKPIDKTLRITKFLCTEYNLDADGRRRKPLKKRKTTRKKK